MFEPLTNLLNDNTPLSSSWGRIVVIAALFAAAWLLARASGVIARRVVDWHDRRNVDIDLEQTGKIAGIKRRETLVGIVRAGIAYTGFAAAGVLGFAQLLGGVDRLTALAGASFVLILAGFAIQRVLTDIIAGLSMFVEGWYSVGDTIVVPALELQGVVEDVSLRRTKLRTLDGEIIHVHNSQIPAVRVLPRGAKELAVEVFVTNRQQAEELVLTIVSMLPEGPTTFVRRPWVERIDSLSETLHRIRVRATVVPGREWLVDGYFVDLLKERAGDGLIAHGPVALSVDESAARSYARASAETRRSAREARTRAA
jgi:moderate conductance mechanosensitive channel